jgi:hypothetical protein
MTRTTYCGLVAARAYADYVTVASYATAYHTTFRDVIEHSHELAVGARKAGKVLGGFPNSDLDIMPMHDYLAMIAVLAGWDERSEHFKSLSEREFQNHSASGFIGTPAPLADQGPLFEAEIHDKCMKGF